MPYWRVWNCGSMFCSTCRICVGGWPIPRPFQIASRFCPLESTNDCAQPAPWPTRITGKYRRRSKPARHVTEATQISPVRVLTATIDHVALAVAASARTKRPVSAARKRESFMPRGYRVFAPVIPHHLFHDRYRRGRIRNGREIDGGELPGQSAQRSFQGGRAVGLRVAVLDDHGALELQAELRGPVRGRRTRAGDDDGAFGDLERMLARAGELALVHEVEHARRSRQHDARGQHGAAAHHDPLVDPAPAADERFVLDDHG